MSLGFRPLCGDTARHEFACGDSEIDKWFRLKALDDHNSYKHLVTCVRHDDDGEKILGFYALSAVTESARQLSGVKGFMLGGGADFPCLQLVYLAVRKGSQNEGYGTAIIGDVIRCFAEIGKLIGIPAMIVTPLNADARRLYERLGFEGYGRNGRLYLPLQSAIAVVEAAEAEAAAEIEAEAEAAATTEPG